MACFRIFISRLVGLFRKRQFEKELAEDLQTHLGMLIEENVRKGMTVEEARYAAQRSFGGAEQVKELYRDQRSFRVLEALLQDLRYAVRMLAKRPGFTAVVTMVMALGIGANTAMFSVVNAVLLRPLPFKDPGRLVSINGVYPLAFISTKGRFEWKVWANGTKTLQDISVYAAGEVNWAGRGEPARIPAVEVSERFFRMLGVYPIRGRTFVSSEESAPRPDAVILSYQLWKIRCGGDPHILGKTVQLDGRPFTVIGMMPEGFDFPAKSQLWLPFPLNFPAHMFGGNTFGETAVARLRHGATIRRGTAELDVIARREGGARYLPELQVIPLQRALVGNIRPALLLLFGAVAVVLLIACADVANLLLSYNIARVREVAIRAALGAGRRRLVRQLLTEGVLLSLGGGAAGIFLGWWAMALARALMPAGTPMVARISMDGWVLLFTCGIAVATGIFAGIIPALRSTAVNLTETLKEGGAGSRSSAGLGLLRLRSAFGVAEIALAFILLAGAVLLIESFARLTSVNPGFETPNLLTTQLTLLGPRYRSETSMQEFYDRVLQHAQALPGVRSAAFANTIPFTHGWVMFLLRAQGRPAPAVLDPEHGSMAIYTVVTPDYFRLIGIPLLRGRSFTPHDTRNATSVAVISQAMARRIWPNQEPIGRRFRFVGADNRWFQVVGVVGDIRSHLDMEPQPQVYFPIAQQSENAAFLAVRTFGKPSALVDSLHSIIHSVDKNEPVGSFRTMNEMISESIASPRFRTVLLGIFAGLALMLAITGIYSIMCYSVSQRTHEIGIRMALGAQKKDVVRLVVGQGVVLTVIGSGIGIAGAIGLTRLLSGMLYGVRPTDPLTLLLVSLVLSCVVLLACYMPALRATKLDPLIALRYE
jgi:predicted permease